MAAPSTSETISRKAMPRIMPNESSRVRSSRHRPPDVLASRRAPDAVERVLQLAEYGGGADQQHGAADERSRRCLGKAC